MGMRIRDKSEKRIDHIVDKIDAMGHESERQGIKWTQYFMKQFEKDEFEKNQIKKEKLDKRARYSRKEYTRVCREMLDQEIKELERPGPGFWVETGYEGEGVWLKLHDRYGRKFARGFKPSGIPKVDLHMINLFMGWTQDKMWEIEEAMLPDKSGIYLSDKIV